MARVSNPLSRVFGDFFAIRRGELLPTLIASSYIFLVIASYIVLKAVRNSLFIDTYGAVKLPYVIIGIAVLVGGFVDIYIRLSRRVRPSILVWVTLIFVSSNLVVFWALAHFGSSSVRNALYPVLYIWTGCYGVIIPVQFWTLFNEVFSTREAKRLVGLIGAGGIIGASVGGFALRAVVPILGTINMLLVVAGAMVVCTLLSVILHRFRLEVSSLGRRPTPPRHLGHSIRKISSSPHLKVLAGLVLIAALTTTIVDWEFNAAAGDAGLERDQLTSFFGTAYGAFALASLVVQALLVPIFLRRFGLGATILTLPLSLLVGTGVMLAFGTLLAATVMKAGDGAFKHSVDRSTKELAYLPVPPELKFQVKSAIDMVLDRLGDGLGGVLLALLATGLGLHFREIGWLNVPLLLGWLYLARRLGASYRRELAGSIGKRETTTSIRGEALTDADAREALRRSLASSDPERVLAALDLAALAPGEDLLADLRRLAQEGNAEVRARVLAVLLDQGEQGLPDGLSEELQQEDQELMVKALDLVLAESPEEIRERADLLLGGASPATQGAMIALLVRRLGQDFEPFAGRILESLLAETTPGETRGAAACALGLLPGNSPLTDRVAPLLKDADPLVRGHAAESAGRLQRRELIPEILPLLAERETRGAARVALASYGSHALPALAEALMAEDTAPSLRRWIPPLLSDIASPGAAEVLLEGVGSSRLRVREHCLRALSRMRRRDPGEPLLTFDRVHREVKREVEHCRWLMGCCSPLETLQRDEGSRESEFLVGAITEARERALGRIFLILESAFPPPEMAAIHGALSHGKSHRDNALELLEDILPRPMRPVLMPFLEGLQSDAAARAIVAPPAGMMELGAALSELDRGPDPWLAACARWVAARREIELGPSPAGTEEESRGINPGEGPLPRAHEDEMESLTQVDKVMALKSIEALRAVPTEHLRHVARAAQERSYAPREHLFREGDPPGPLFIVLKGRIGLERTGVPAGEVREGSPLGAWSLFDDQPRSSDAVALEETQVLMVDREDFYDAIAEHPAIASSLLSDMLRRLRRTLLD